MDEFKAQVRLEREDATEIEAYRLILMETITPIKKIIQITHPSPYDYLTLGVP